MIRTAFILSAIAAATAVSALASADNMTYAGLDYSGTLTGSVTFLNASDNDQTENVYIGKLLFKDGGNTVATVCADISSILDGSSHSYSPSMTNPGSTSPLDLAGNIVAADFNKATNAHDAAALQIAVWSVLYNGGTTFSADGAGFKVTGVSDSVLQLAATYYGDRNTPGQAEYFQTPSGKGGQSQLAPAPEPASLAALGMGLIGIFSRRRRARA